MASNTTQMEQFSPIRLEEMHGPWKVSPLYDACHIMHMSAEKASGERSVPICATPGFQYNKHGLDCTLSVRDIVLMWCAQRGRCAYLDIPMTLSINSSWRCTLGRNDESLGYSVDNCVLICQEVNQGVFKWSREEALKFWPRH